MTIYRVVVTKLFAIITKYILPPRYIVSRLRLFCIFIKYLFHSSSVVLVQSFISQQYSF